MSDYGNIIHSTDTRRQYGRHDIESHSGAERGRFGVGRRYSYVGHSIQTLRHQESFDGPP